MLRNITEERRSHAEVSVCVVLMRKRMLLYDYTFIFRP